MKNKSKQPITNPFLSGKIPPQAVDLEEAVLGAVILESEAIEIISSILSVSMFYDPRHRVIYEAVLLLYRENKPVDLLTVAEKLKSLKQLETAGGAYYISQLTNKVSGAAHVEYHATVIKQKHIGRKLIEISSKSISECYDDEDSIAVLEDMEKELSSLFMTFAGTVKAKHISFSAEKATQNAYDRVKMAREGVFSGISTGLSSLDSVTAGWKGGELVVIAARPGMGKTAFLLHFSKAAANHSNTPACIFSLEMTAVSLADRLILSETDIDPDKYKSGYLNNDEISEIEHAKEKISQYDIYIDDSPSISMQYVRNKAKALKKENKCGIILMDYLQLGAEPTDDKNKLRNREQEISSMTRQAKAIAKELDVPFILLSQLSRAVESRGGEKRPMLSDLRESGAIEQDADIIIFPYRPAYYGIEGKNGEDLRGFGELIIGKHRNGGTGSVFFGHNPALTKIYDYKKQNEF